VLDHEVTKYLFAEGSDVDELPVHGDRSRIDLL
jgi:hypothetical protein